MNKILDFWLSVKSRVLYRLLSDEKYMVSPFQREDKGEGMFIVYESIEGYWKPRWLVDERSQTAVEFMGHDLRLCTVSPLDVDWASLNGFSERSRSVARQFSFCFPSDVGRFKNGIANVRWQLNPDGRFFMDEDGFGMTPDVAENIYGKIDRSGKVVVKFSAVRDCE